MNQIVKLLMERDNLSENEGQAWYDDVKEMLNEAFQSGDYNEAEIIMRQELGLEMDYIFEFM